MTNRFLYAFFFLYFKLTVCAGSVSFVLAEVSKNRMPVQQSKILFSSSTLKQNDTSKDLSTEDLLQAEKQMEQNKDKKSFTASPVDTLKLEEKESQPSVQKSVYFSGSRVALKGSHYIFKPVFPIQLKDYFSLYGNLNLKVKKNSLLFQMSGITEGFFDKSRQFYWTIPEMYLSYQHNLQQNRFVDSLKVYVGRHIKKWSQTDTYWEFGNWNSLNLWDPLYPSENGLIGAFLDIEGKHWLFEFYVGGIHLPHVKPKLQRDQESDGIHSSSRWANTPPVAVDLAGLKLDIGYLVNFLIERLRHDSYGLSWTAWATEKKNIWLKGNFGYKPSNDLFLTENAENSLRVTAATSAKEKQPLSIQKDIENYTVRQQILSMEGGLRFGGFSTLVSAFQSKMRIPRALSKGRKFVKDPLEHAYLSGLAGYEFSLWKNMETKFQMGYLHSLGKKKIFSGRLTNHKLLQGVSFDWIVKSLNTKGLKREISLRYWHSLEKWKSLFSMNLLVHLLPEWYVGGEVNIIAGKKGDTSFFGEFRSNDYISWRTGYVF